LYTISKENIYTAITLRLQAITGDYRQLQTITVRLQTITSDYSAITGIYLCVGSAGEHFQMKQ